MNNQELLFKILEDHLQVKVENISLDSNILEDLGGDSLSAVEIVMSIEEDFDIEIDDNDIDNLVIVKDMLDYINERA